MLLNFKIQIGDLFNQNINIPAIIQQLLRHSFTGLNLAVAIPAYRCIDPFYLAFKSGSVNAQLCNLNLLAGLFCGGGSNVAENFTEFFKSHSNIPPC
ncbi:hypothetical protein SDC9_104579 [bioreactor metagenome]|uniref:Uncharacterized protein n=1 Tax=bioreactor metagenome TaxID=1076179 RepID=A0A645AYA1_9ZZZZ